MLWWARAIGGIPSLTISIVPCQWRLSMLISLPLSISRPMITRGPRRRAVGLSLSGPQVRDSAVPQFRIHTEPRVNSTTGGTLGLARLALDRNHLIRLLPACLLHI